MARIEETLKTHIARYRNAIFYLVFLVLCCGLCTSAVWSDSTGGETAELSHAAPIRLAEKAPESAPGLRIDRFEFAIKMFEWKDRRHPPPPGCTVFIGSSTFTKWRDLEETFKEFGAINRGFGGATIPEVNHYVSRIITKYKPSKIVFYCGSNDIAELHHDGQQVFDDFKTFVKLVHDELPACQIYFVSESVAPCRESMASEFSKCNSLAQAFIRPTPNLHYINVLPVMQDKNGKLRTELFGWDHLHMNADGYALWTPIIETALKSGK